MCSGTIHHIPRRSSANLSPFLILFLYILFPPCLSLCSLPGLKKYYPWRYELRTEREREQRMLSGHTTPTPQFSAHSLVGRGVWGEPDGAVSLPFFFTK